MEMSFQVKLNDWIVIYILTQRSVSIFYYLFLDEI